MFGDPAAADVVALPAVFAGGRLRSEVEAAEEERAVRLLAQRLGAAAQFVAQDFGVGARGEGVLAVDDVLGRTVDHAGQGCAAGVVERAFLGEGMAECVVGCRHSIENNVTELHF